MYLRDDRTYRAMNVSCVHTCWMNELSSKCRVSATDLNVCLMLNIHGNTTDTHVSHFSFSFIHPSIQISLLGFISAASQDDRDKIKKGFV